MERYKANMSISSENRDWLLVFDVGTQSVRAAVIDLRGNIRKLIKTPIDPYFSHQPGWAEQEPDYYWQNLAATANGSPYRSLQTDMRCR